MFNKSRIIFLSLALIILNLFQNSLQSQNVFTASVEPSGKIQISTMLPEASYYEFDLRLLNSITNDTQANAFFSKYINAGFINFSYDFSRRIGKFRIEYSKIQDGLPTLKGLNNSLLMVFQYGR